MTYDEILSLLVTEALADRDTGWLSDMGNFNLSHEESTGSIRVGNGSIDVAHLASIVLEIQEGQR